MLRMLGCNAENRTLDASEFSKPLPWIGLYIAAASLLCALAMAADAFGGFLHRRLWFPSRFFPLNATTLTLLGVATKLPVDLNTSMPGRLDQLVKLSSTVLICIVMGNLMPSLGAMDDSDITSNIVALGILVITVIVNVCIQMGTGVIYVYLYEHIVIMFFMLVLLLIMISSALTVTITKRLLDQQYDHKHALDADDGEADNKYAVERLKEYVKKYWLMANTGTPQYVLGRSATSTAAGAFCLLSALILVEVSVRSLIKKSKRICDGTSDYGWSITFIFVAQAIAVLVGTFAPAYRWFSAVNFRTPGGKRRCMDELKVEGYWVQRLMDWRESPLPFQIGSRRSRRIAHDLKNLILVVFIGLQSGVVLVSKLVQLALILPVSWLNRGRKLLKKSESSSNTSHAESGDLSKYVLYLEGEEDLVPLITRSGRKDTEQWIKRGKMYQPINLIELINKYSTHSRGFTGVGGFDSDKVLSLVYEEPPNCWALPVVTLASIAVALHDIDKKMIESLLKGVSEGLRYIKLVEKHLDAKGLLNMREAADIVWLEVDLYNRWFSVNLQSYFHEDKNDKRIIEKLENTGKNCVEDYQKEMKTNETSKNPLEWPAKVLAANCMYRVSRTILQNYDHIHETNDNLFVWLRMTISDMLGACLTNLPRVIYMECISSAIEVREESVREAAFLLGEAEKIMEMVGNPEVASLCPRETEYIDNWREERCNPSSFPSTSSYHISSFTSDELSLFIE